jgi:GDPmannose 4,6-dehydratase
MRALITGITGQDGPYLAKFLISKGYEVHGVVRSHSPTLKNLDFFHIRPQITLHLGDVSSGPDMLRVVEQGFDEIYNLAAQSFVGSSWDQATSTTHINALGPLNLLEAIRRASPRTKFYQASTSEMFGNSPAPQGEETPMMPRSPYGVAKLYGHHITRNYRESHNLFACSGILFNHESPLRGPQFVTRKITLGIADIIGGRAKTLALGNLDARRDWGYAGDYVRAMWMMLQQPRADDYVVATGESHTIRDFLFHAFDRVGLRWEDHITRDPRFVRPAEVHWLEGDPTKIRDIGWEPDVTFRQLVNKMVDWDCYNRRS